MQPLRSYPNHFAIAVILWLSLASPASQASEGRPLQEQIDKLRGEVEVLNFNVEYLRKGTAAELVRVDCYSKRFDELRLASSPMFVLVSCSKAESYLEGHRIVLEIGNPYSFNLLGASGLLKYGRTMNDASATTKQLSGITLLAGRSTTVEAIVPAATAEHLRFVLLELRIESVSSSR
jgi:hypothetical protein